MASHFARLRPLTSNPYPAGLALLNDAGTAVANNWHEHPVQTTLTGSIALAGLYYGARYMFAHPDQMRNNNNEHSPFFPSFPDPFTANENPSFEPHPDTLLNGLEIDPLQTPRIHIGDIADASREAKSAQETPNQTPTTSIPTVRKTVTETKTTQTTETIPRYHTEPTTVTITAKVTEFLLLNPLHQNLSCSHSHPTAHHQSQNLQPLDYAALHEQNCSRTFYLEPFSVLRAEKAADEVQAFLYRFANKETGLPHFKRLVDASAIETCNPSWLAAIKDFRKDVLGLINDHHGIITGLTHRCRIVYNEGIDVHPRQRLYGELQRKECNGLYKALAEFWKRDEGILRKLERRGLSEKVSTYDGYLVLGLLAVVEYYERFFEEGQPREIRAMYRAISERDLLDRDIDREEGDEEEESSERDESSDEGENNDVKESSDVEENSNEGENSDVKESGNEGESEVKKGAEE
ncbi:hypothetical protein M011DRAFT_514787 [Sporormia fimetaria CBS 119925]|uniref:Uncharacterized protein n=1 Tax=Sporormia fimetaria CBS 119925 TaxID=1340428 RepID=A0A6A6UW74_9PLEO|nr:hypothetical protein M011DRAFT_514787 [Sporormia fimetaria CBS 119925]